MDTVRVGGEGPLNCKIAFIGEAPGAQEEKYGKPFVGPAGQLFNEVLRQSAINRSNCYITNVVKERPPKNNIKVFIDLSKKSRPSTPAYDRYVAELKEELTRCKANVFVPLGNIPFYTLTGLTGITKWRGSILESTLIPGRKVIPTIHPSAALKQYTYRYFIQHDFKRAFEESEQPKILPLIRKLEIAPSYNDTIMYLKMCKKRGLIGFDIEVMNEELSCISFSPKRDEAMSIPFTEGGREYFPVDQEVNIMKAIATVLEDPFVAKVGQNVLFDTFFLFWKYGIRTRNLHDTMVGQAILFPDFPKGLDFITSIYTKEPYYKDEGKRRFKGGGTDRDFWIYNAKDSMVLMEVFPQIYKDLEKTGNLDTYKRQVKIIEPLLYMTGRGIRMDTKGLKIESKKVGDKIEALTGELSKATKGRIDNPNSVKQARDYFYIYKGIKPYYKRGTGRVRIDEDALKRLNRKGHKEAGTLLKIRHLAKLKGTYLDMKLDKDDRLRCSYNPVGTTTGRLSSSKTIFNTGMNMQNQPSEMKKYMLADNGYIAYSIDLNQAENRVVAFVAPETMMISAFDEGRDIHRQTAGLILSKPFDEVSDKPGSSSIGDGRSSERFWGKKANHALNYGMGYKRFAFEYEIMEMEAKRIVERYHAIYPGIRQYHSWVKQTLSKGRTVSNCYGRRRLFLDRWGDNLFIDAYAFIPQSTIADKINQDGLLYIHNHQDIFSPVELLNQEHDSITFQISRECKWSVHADILMKIRDSLEGPIRWRSIEFSIPTTLNMGLDLGGVERIKLNEYSHSQTLAHKLRRTYETKIISRGR